jgi:hypothetical protein
MFVSWQQCSGRWILDVESSSRSMRCAAHQATHDALLTLYRARFSYQNRSYSDGCDGALAAGHRRDSPLPSPRNFGRLPPDYTPRFRRWGMW